MRHYYLTDLIRTFDPDDLLRLDQTTGAVAVRGQVVSDRQRDALRVWAPTLVQYAQADREVITALDLYLRVTESACNVPPCFVVVPHETHGWWLAGPPDFVREYYPTLAAARAAAWNWLTLKERGTAA